jgi:hypothetical protein
MPRAELSATSIFNGATSQSSSGASSPRRGRPRGPVLIMSSQVPRLSDNRLHPYSQLSQSPVSPSLFAKDSRSGAGPIRLSAKSRLDQSSQSLRQQLSSPVIRPQRDQSSADEMPSPLLLPAQYATTPMAQPLKQFRVNKSRPKSATQENGVDLSGLTNKLGFHEPSRETITPRGSDDEGEDLVMFPKPGRDGRRAMPRTHTRNSRSLCIEDKARGRRKQQHGEATVQIPQRKAFSEQPSKSNGLDSPSERRGRSRDVKPCSRSIESAHRQPVPQVTVETYDGYVPVLDEGYDAGAFETATVETMLASDNLTESSDRLHLADGDGMPNRGAVPGSSGLTFPRMLARSSVQSTRRNSQLTTQSWRGSEEHGFSTPPNGVDKETDKWNGEKNIVQPRGVPLPVTDKAKSTKASPTTCNSSLATLSRPRPFTALSEKSCATVVKQTTNVFAPPSPANSIVELTDGEGSAVSSVNSLQLPRRSASISLKRIQDQDLENILESSAIRIPSPITSPRMSIAEEAPIDPPPITSEEIVQVTVEPATSPPKHAGPLHRLRNALPVHKDAMPKARALLKIAAPGTPRPVRSVSHQVLPSQVSCQANDNTSGSLGRGILKRGRTASTATDGGDQKRVYTRWDGVQTPITKEDHPVHWEILQTREQLRRQGSKQSPRHGLLAQSRSSVANAQSNRSGTASESGFGSPPSTPPSPHAGGSVLPSRVVSLTSLAHHAVSSLTRPISHRHKSAPLRVPSYKPTGTVHQNLFGGDLRPSFSQESLAVPSHESLASSFDSKVAYKACRKEEGYVNFDKVLGLSNHASREEIAAMVRENGT